MGEHVLTEDEGREEPGTADAMDEGETSELPEFLRTEPIPIAPAPVPEQPVAPALEDAPPSEAMEPTTEELSMPAQKKSRSTAKRGLMIGAIGVLLLAMGYTALAWFYSDRVPADTVVAGIDVSGLSRTDAVHTLQTGLEDVMTTPIAVALGDAESEIEPEAAGLSVDIDGTVDELVGFSMDPRAVFAHLFGKGPHDPIIVSDSTAMRRALTTIAMNLDIAPVEGELAIVDGELEEVRPEDGLAVDVDGSAGEVTDQWLQGPRPIELPSVVVPPTMDTEKIAHARSTVVDPLLSGPVPLSVNEHQAEIAADVIAGAASLKLVGSTYEVRMDPEMLADEVADLLPELGESPKNARFEFHEGKPRIVPSVAGAGINPEELADVVGAAATRTGEGRSAEIELETTEPEFTTEDAQALGVKERVSHFSTPIPYDPPRTKNLVNGAKNLNGILIKPGETFSLIEALGPIDGAHGYVSSGVVVNGFSDTAMGGGLSQMSTTTFNAAFEAGMEDITHTPHSRHFTRYPEGREATMFAPDLDMKWRNNTPYGVLVQSWIDDRAHVALWSTKYWDTKITTGPRTNFTAPQTIYNTSPRCTPESGGSSGFTVSIQRIVSKDGVRNDEYSRSYTHTYQPWNHVICGEKPKPASQDSDDD